MKPLVESFASRRRVLPRASDPVAVAVDLAPRIRELAAEGEAQGYVSKEITDAAVSRGLYSLMVPAEFGGLEPKPSVLLDVIEELSAADGSTGWAIMAPMTATATLLSILPIDGAEALASSENWIVAGQVAPTGTAVAADGGYTISGRFTFASGSQAAGWILGGFVVKDNSGKVVPGPDGQRQVLTCLMPSSQTNFFGGWSVLGLTATNSVDYEIPEQFIPHALVASDNIPKRGGALFTMGLRSLTGIGHAGFALGITRAALQEFVELANKKSRPPSGLLSLHETIQRDYATWVAQARAAKAFVHEAFSTVYDLQLRGEAPTASQEADCRLAATHAVYTAAALTRDMYLASGSEGLRNGSIIQRCFRDAHASSQHMLTGAHVYVEAGRIYLDTPGLTQAHMSMLDNVFAPPLPR